MITRRSFVSFCAASAAAAAPRKPNFVVILVDDLGWTDLGSFGSDFYRTPHIDRLAAEGMKFSQAYSACTVCSPSRAALLTGKYPARLHLTDWIAGHRYPWAKLNVPDWAMRLPLAEITIAESLKTAGYATASIGKWHLGEPDHFPEKQGFDLNLAGTSKGQPPSYFSPYGIATLPDGPAGEYLTDRESFEALHFLETNRERPFFVYLAHHAVHNPIQSKPEVVSRYQERAHAGAAHSKAGYAALIESVDDSVGRIRAKLRELKLDQDTVVLLTSDNGGLLQNTSNAPLRAGKGSAYEGGVRVPLIVRWPRQIKAGTICAVPVIGIDYAPTVRDIAGVARIPADGESLLPLFKGERRLKRDTLYWHYPHYHPGGATPYSAIREREFRLVEFHEDNGIELYNLANDTGEEKDLASALPVKAQELKNRLGLWRTAVGAQMPSTNPRYDPKKASQRAR